MAEADPKLDPQAVDLDSPEARALIAEQVKKQVDENTSGLQQNRDDILKEKRDLENKLKGVDLEKYAELVEKESSAEDAKLKSEGEHEVLFEKRLAKIEEDSRARNEELTKRAEEAEHKADNATTSLENRVVGDEIRDKAIAAGVVEAGALNDIVEKGLKTFVRENGELVARDSNGELLKNNDNFIVTTERFVEGLKATHSYYFPASISAGAQGSGGNGGKQSLSELASAAAERGDMSEYTRIRTLMKDK